jgi:hypothetical protein
MNAERNVVDYVRLELSETKLEIPSCDEKSHDRRNDGVQPFPKNTTSNNEVWER